MLESILCDYNGYYALAKGTLTVNAARAGAVRNTQVTFKKCTPFTNCINQMNNAQVKNADYLDIVPPMYKLKEYNSNYEKENVQFVYGLKDVSNNNIVNSKSVTFKRNVTRRTPAEMTLIIC